MATDFTTADLIDEHGDTLRSCATQFRGYGGRAFFAGPIRTVKCHEDNGLVKQVLNTPGEGAVLVVDGGGSLRSALMGDMIAEAAVTNGWSGWSSTERYATRRSWWSRPGGQGPGFQPSQVAQGRRRAPGRAVSFGEVTFVPGEWLYSDHDGIVVNTTRV